MQKGHTLFFKGVPLSAIKNKKLDQSDRHTDILLPVAYRYKSALFSLGILKKCSGSFLCLVCLSSCPFLLLTYYYY